MMISQQGLDLIKQFEGFRSAPYRDAAGIPTIGYGATYYPDGTTVRMTDMPISEKQASAMLVSMVERYAEGVNRYVQVHLTQTQFDALVSFSYNVGLDAVRNSTLLRKLNAGDYAGAAEQFARWNQSGGVVLAGLTKRRAAEADLFNTAGADTALA